MSKKRVVAGLMSAMLCVGSLTAFAEAQDPMAKYPETVKLTSCKSVSDSMQNFIDKKSDVLTDNIWFNSYRDELGIEVEYAWTAPGAQYEEFLSSTPPPSPRK